ncbi:hypothetical protein [Allosphingosinicella sp.]|uniref:hypothetical protein n=1 Tax=Allosphingosinicella sp. TaxID=2823234 RepID=UPI002EE3576F
MSLILAERDGKLEIVAGGVPVEPEARRLVMRRATETAASFGLTVGQYSLNGVALGSGRGETLWRFHGTRTR